MLVERVKHVAKSNSLDVGDLLGVIMAHEMGHLLLPPDSHATGVMAPRLDPFLIEHGGLAFDPRQASMIRERIGSMPRSEQRPCRASGSF